MGRRRTFGTVRKLRSGRYQARYLDRGGHRHRAPRTFATKADAGRWLAGVEADMARGAWIDPRAGVITLSEYADGWLASRPGLRPRTTELIVRNPCGIKGAGIERSPERPVATIAQVWALADVVQPRFRGLVLTAAFAGLRFGELAALTRARVDLDARTISVVDNQVELSDGTVLLGPPKSDAGRRTIVIPDALVPELTAHLDTYVASGDDARVFTGTEGAPLRRQNWWPKWKAAREAVELDRFRFHDLRHTCNTLTAATGASTRELMHRMGHSSAAAALRYQHATRDRDAVIARALNDVIEAGRANLSIELDRRPVGRCSAASSDSGVSE